MFYEHRMWIIGSRTTHHHQHEYHGIICGSSITGGGGTVKKEELNLQWCPPLNQCTTFSHYGGQTIKFAFSPLYFTTKRLSSMYPVSNFPYSKLLLPFILPRSTFPSLHTAAVLLYIQHSIFSLYKISFSSSNHMYGFATLLLQIYRKERVYLEAT